MIRYIESLSQQAALELYRVAQKEWELPSRDILFSPKEIVEWSDKVSGGGVFRVATVWYDPTGQVALLEPSMLTAARIEVVKPFAKRVLTKVRIRFTDDDTGSSARILAWIPEETGWNIIVQGGKEVSNANEFKHNHPDKEEW